MTAVRERRNDPKTGDDDAVPWDERAGIGSFRGMPWWGAAVLAFGVALVGAVVDMQVTDGLNWTFQGAYLAGSLAAVVVAQRRNLFGPMVQPPLVLAITVPLVVLTGSGMPQGSDTLAAVLAVSTPLINAFPMMAVATALTVVVGIVRTYREQDPDSRGKRPPWQRGGNSRGSKSSDKKPVRKPSKPNKTVDEDDGEEPTEKAARPSASNGPSGRKPAGPPGPPSPAGPPGASGGRPPGRSPGPGRAGGPAEPRGPGGTGRAPGGGKRPGGGPPGPGRRPQPKDDGPRWPGLEPDP